MIFDNNLLHIVVRRVKKLPVSLNLHCQLKDIGQIAELNLRLSSVLMKSAEALHYYVRFWFLICNSSHGSTDRYSRKSRYRSIRISTISFL